MLELNKFLMAIICIFLIAGITSGEQSDDGNMILLKNAHFNTSGLTMSKITISQYQPEVDYYIVQFRGHIQDEWKDSVKGTGAILFDYVPNNAFIVKMNASVKSKVEMLDFVQWTGIYHADYRISPVLSAAGMGIENITILLFDAKDNVSVSNEIKNLGGEVVDDSGHILKVSIDRARISEIAALSGVNWIEKHVQPVILNDIGANITWVYNVRNTYGLDGSGQIVGVSDTGLDTGVNDSTMHDDIKGRIVALIDRSGDGAADNFSGHGSHVSGSVLGNGSRSGGQFKGMAPNSRLVFQALEDSNGYLTGIPEDLNVLFQQAYDDGARIHTNSWGADVNGEYTVDSQNLDMFMWSHPDMLILMAAGNSGVDSGSPLGVIDPDSIGSPATAKNCISVGATENIRPSFPYTWYGSWPADFPYDPIRNDKLADNASGLAAFSSRGPTDDGRIKPDVVAPGTFIISLRSSVASEGLWGDYDAYYRYSGGTSMATPLVAGTAALVRQYYVQNKSITPSAALLKATIINGASNLTPGQYGPGAVQEILRRPDYAQGWGLVNLTNTLFPDAPRTMHYYDNTTGLSTSSSWNKYYYVNDTSKPLRVTLVWTDYKGNPAAGIQLVNRLTLNVSAPSGGYYLGNGGDSLNNVEEIELLSPSAGLYNVRVEGTNVPQGPQPFAVVISGAFAVSGINLTNITGLTQSVPAGTNATYSFTLNNNGSMTDNYTISVTNPNNAVYGLNITSPVMVAAGATQVFTLNVTNASSGIFPLNFTVNSSNDPDKTTYIRTLTTVAAVGNVTNITISWNSNGSIAISWNGTASSYDVYTTSNYTAGFGNTPTVTLTGITWTDTNALSYSQRYYRVAPNGSGSFNQTLGKFDLQLKTGMNLVSLPLIPSDYNLTSLLHQNDTFYPVIEIFDRQANGVYRIAYFLSDNPPDFWWSSDPTFTNLSMDKGYWFKLSADSNLTVVGSVPTSGRTVTLNNGMNLVGWSSINTTRLQTAIPQTDTSYNVTEIFDRQANGVYRIAYFLSDNPPDYWWSSDPTFDNLQPGKGYWFKVTGQYTWSYNP